MRSEAAGKSAMPATAKRVSGKTSVCWRPVCSAERSSSEPGTADACAVKLSISEIKKSAKKAMIRIVPCINKAGPSMTTDFTAAVAEDWLCTRHTCAKAKIIEPNATVF